MVVVVVVVVVVVCVFLLVCVLLLVFRLRFVSIVSQGRMRPAGSCMFSQSAGTFRPIVLQVGVISVFAVLVTYGTLVRRFCFVCCVHRLVLQCFRGGLHDRSYSAVCVRVRFCPPGVLHLTALRVHPTVTRLTVYRQPYVGIFCKSHIS